MEDNIKLNEKIEITKNSIKKYNPDIINIPNYIKDNVIYDLFPWQKEALENFFVYEEEYNNDPTHLMFNMATGSGKTLLMATLLLYYYKNGYRNFIFFVNANNVVDKTEKNFLEQSHNKYLFNKKIVINNKQVKIKKVEAFSKFTEDIEIKFTTIQQLYNDIHIEKENQTTLDDLHKRDIVMLADEAHHLNANTKKYGQQELDFKEEITGRTSEDEIERKGWEHTVIELILNKNGNNKNNKNVLLEFTATIPSDSNVKDKYKNKIVYKFGLKKFLQAGYTKEINLISSSLNKKNRILQALLFNWYRHKIALKYNIPNFKPVILFRSKKIKESKEDYLYFKKLIKNLSVEDFNFLNKLISKVNQSDSLYEQGRSRTKDVINFIENEKINISEIVHFIKYNFKERNCIITNSEDNNAKTIEKTSEEQEKLLNNLEDKNNNIRAVFTVKRLTEGWDVLNLFDIVRLYQGQNTGGSTEGTPEATTQEKQLIGRGVRYYPFKYNNKIANKRKFDDNLNHELRFLEELFYYTYDEKSRYISHLKNELRKDGYIDDGKTKKTFNIKNSFKESDFYKKAKIFYNNKKENPDRKKQQLNDIDKNFFDKYYLKSLELHEEQIDLNDDADIERLNITEKDLNTINVKIKNFDKHIFNKAINIKASEINSLYRYERLKNELDLDSIIDLMKDKFLGDFNIQIISSENKCFSDVPNKDKLNILIKFLEDFSNEFTKYINPEVGTEFKLKDINKIFNESKTKVVNSNDESIIKESELINKDWYVLDAFHGTSEERYLIEHIQETIVNLKDCYDEVFLLRNEEVYKIFSFDEGRGFQPDFILLLRTKNESDSFYQIFIEPKGEHLMEKDAWKEGFLKQITNRYGINNIIKYENDKYRLIGLPLFNKDNNQKFNEKYKKLLNSTDSN